MRRPPACLTSVTGRPATATSTDRPSSLKHEILSIDARSARLAQPRDDAQEVSRKRRFQEHDFVTPGHEHAPQSLQPLQIETEERRMVDRCLFQIIEIGRVVDVTERVDLMEPDPKIGLERWNAADPGVSPDRGSCRGALARHSGRHEESRFRRFDRLLKDAAQDGDGRGVGRIHPVVGQTARSKRLGPRVGRV